MKFESGPGKYGTTLDDLSTTDPDVVERIRNHHGPSLPDIENMTPGEIQHHDVEYGQADPHVEASLKTTGDETARGGSGPR